MKRFFAAALVLLVPSLAVAGAVGGPVNHKDTVMPLSTDSFVVVFEKDRKASVVVSGDGSTDLDCAAYDSGGNLVDSDTNPGDLCTLDWTPAWTGKFTLKIMNLGKKPNEYSLRTN